MNLLVTGGAGYVGSHVVRSLIYAGHDVWVYDNLLSGHREAIPSSCLIVGDLHNRLLLQNTLRTHSIDAVLHFAALIEVGKSVLDPAVFYENNVSGTIALMQAMLETNVERFILSSTAAVYGETQKPLINEDVFPQPKSPYGFTKYAIETALADFAKAYNWSYATLRYFNACGASPEGDIGEDHQPESHLIPLVLQVALGQRDHISVFGADFDTPDGTCVRDYIHVDDLASAHRAALEELAANVELKLNLGVGRGFSVYEVIESCRRVTGHPIPVKVVSRRAGDVSVLVADSSRARSRLGWKPKYVELDAIIETAWRWHASHPNGYHSHQPNL